MLIVALAGAVACAAESGDPEADGSVLIGGQRVWIEIVEGIEEQSLGLGQRDSLAWDHGMYFPYARAAFYVFWMKDMRFDIDIVWIRDGRVIDLHHRVAHAVEPPLPRYRPREAADAVLEVPAGYAQAHGWGIGDRVRLERRPAKP